MKLTVFPSDKGDCLLLTSRGDRRRILVDGGMRASYREFVAPSLALLSKAGAKLDLVYVSHIDQDHISGVLQMMDDLVAWRVHDFRAKEGIKPNPKPDAPQPPEVKAIWHNAFHDMVKINKGPIGDMMAAAQAEIVAGSSVDILSAAASVFAGAKEDTLAPVDEKSAADGLAPFTMRELAEEYQELATSIPEALHLSRRIGNDQLGIPLNKHFGGKLAFVRTQDKPKPILLAPLRIFVIGPFEEDLVKLRADWNKWLDENKKKLDQIRDRAREDASRMHASEIPRLPDLAAAQANMLLGDRKNVTPPNLASLMLYVEEGAKTLLLTGDGHSGDILKGLAHHKKLNKQGALHVDVLKVQHHGSEHNMDEDFAKKITADHYIFCGNGEHENPDFRIVDLILDVRLANPPVAGADPRVQAPFKLWFNSSEAATERAPAKKHMRELEQRLRARATASGGRVTAEFLAPAAGSFDIDI